MALASGIYGDAGRLYPTVKKTTTVRPSTTSAASIAGLRSTPGTTSRKVFVGSYVAPKAPTFRVPISTVAGLGSLAGSSLYGGAAAPGVQPTDFAPTYQPGTETFVDPAAAITAALAARSRDEAQAQANSKLKQAAIQYGVGDYGAGTAGTNNPYSVLSVLKRNYDTGVSDLEDKLNKGNLFYSGYRGKQLNEAGTQYGQQKAEAGYRYQGLVSDINTALQQALLQADIMSAQAGGGGGGGGGDAVDNSAYVPGERTTSVSARPGELGDLPVVAPYNPARNKDAKYDLSGATKVGDNRYMGPTGLMYDSDGRRV